MKHYALKGIFLSALALAVTGCEAPNTATTNANNQPSTNANATASPIAATPANVNYERLAEMSPVTLPVLDALFYNDEKFADDLKAQVGLSDEQVNKLKETSRTRVQELSGDDENGSTSESRRIAAQVIRETIGDDKAQAVNNFILARMNNAGDMTAANADASGTNTANGTPTDTRIVVNAPAYRMDMFENGELVKSYKIGIGYPEFPLPQGLRKADTLIYNPTWTPPDEPWVRASNTIKAGQKVDAGNKLNPLGPIKIPIGMPSLIHGGKQVAKLGGFASHGCVGLTDAQVQTFARDLATLAGTDLTEERIKEIQKDKTKTENIKLGQAIPVELRYDTVVVEDGKLKIYRDVYERGTNTEENMRRVLEGFGVSFDSLSEAEKTKIATALKQMSRDAQGNVSDGGNMNANNMNANSNTNSNMTSNAANKNANAANSNAGNRVTRTIKGAKEVAIPLAALKGKGYPAPVNFDTGAGKSKLLAQTRNANTNTSRNSNASSSNNNSANANNNANANAGAKR